MFTISSQPKSDLLSEISANNDKNPKKSPQRHNMIIQMTKVVLILFGFSQFSHKISEGSGAFMIFTLLPLNYGPFASTHSFLTFLANSTIILFFGSPYSARKSSNWSALLNSTNAHSDAYFCLSLSFSVKSFRRSSS